MGPARRRAKAEGSGIIAKQLVEQVLDCGLRLPKVAARLRIFSMLVPEAQEVTLQNVGVEVSSSPIVPDSLLQTSSSTFSGPAVSESPSVPRDICLCRHCSKNTLSYFGHCTHCHVQFDSGSASDGVAPLREFPDRRVCPLCHTTWTIDDQDRDWHVTKPWCLNCDVSLEEPQPPEIDDTYPVSATGCVFRKGDHKCALCTEKGYIPFQGLSPASFDIKDSVSKLRGWTKWAEESRRSAFPTCILCRPCYDKCMDDIKEGEQVQKAMESSIAEHHDELLASVMEQSACEDESHFPEIEEAIRLSLEALDASPSDHPGGLATASSSGVSHSPWGQTALGSGDPELDEAFRISLQGAKKTPEVDNVSEKEESYICCEYVCCIESSTGSCVFHHAE